MFIGCIERVCQKGYSRCVSISVSQVCVRGCVIGCAIGCVMGVTHLWNTRGQIHLPHGTSEGVL